jgi:hypothetical protein
MAARQKLGATHRAGDTQPRRRASASLVCTLSKESGPPQQELKASHLVVDGTRVQRSTLQTFAEPAQITLAGADYAGADVATWDDCPSSPADPQSLLLLLR